MKLLIEPQSKNKLYQDKVDGLILSLKDYAVQSPIYYTVEEIKKIREENSNVELFINILKTQENAVWAIKLKNSKKELKNALVLKIKEMLLLLAQAI